MDRRTRLSGGGRSGGSAGIHGTPEAARETVARFAAIGVERVVLQDFRPWDLDMIDVMGEALIGQV